MVAALAHPNGKIAKESVAIIPSFEQLAMFSTVLQIANYSKLQMCCRTPAQIASLAIATGASCAAAYALHKVAMVSMMQFTAEFWKDCLVAPLADNPDASLLNQEAFEKCAWVSEPKT